MSTRKYDSTMNFNKPILFLTFNRPDVTLKVFKQIKAVKPDKLYLASDGARSNRENEINIVDSLRKKLINEVSWDCEIKTLFQENNLGCRNAVSSAIDWFFKNEEEGIIIEDDCLPTQSFFHYCSIMLDKYKLDKRVWHINGFNPLSNITSDETYFFSLIPSVWGWATWRDRWKEYDVNIANYKEVRDNIKSNFPIQKLANFWIDKFDQSPSVDTWDYQWLFTVLNNNGLCTRPSLNLIQNLGFGEDATHTKNQNNFISNLESKELDLNKVVHPKSFIPRLDKDEELYYVRMHHSIFKSIKNKLKL